MAEFLLLEAPMVGCKLRIDNLKQGVAGREQRHAGPAIPAILNHPTQTQAPASLEQKIVVCYSYVIAPKLNGAQIRPCRHPTEINRLYPDHFLSIFLS